VSHKQLLSPQLGGELLEYCASVDLKPGEGPEQAQGLFAKVFSVGRGLTAYESVFMAHFTNTGQ